MPEVRLLPEAEIMQREAAVAAFRCNLKSQGQVQMPDELQDVLRGQPGEGSSSEDTSDEAYMTRHQPKEEEERQRFLGIPGGESLAHLLYDMQCVLLGRSKCMHPALSGVLQASKT